MQLSYLCITSVIMCVEISPSALLLSQWNAQLCAGVQHFRREKSCAVFFWLEHGKEATCGWSLAMNSRILVVGMWSGRWGGRRRVWNSWRQFVLSCQGEERGRRKTSEVLHSNDRKFSLSSLRIQWLNCKCESSGPNPLIPLWERVLVVLQTCKAASVKPVIIIAPVKSHAWWHLSNLFLFQTFARYLKKNLM